MLKGYISPSAIDTCGESVNKNILIIIYLIILSLGELIASIYTSYKPGIILFLLLFIGLIISLMYNTIKLYKNRNAQ